MATDKSNIEYRNHIISDDSKSTLVNELHELMGGSPKKVDEKVYKGIYFKKEVADFLEKLPNGKRSEIVNKVMMQFLRDNDFLE